MKKNLLLGIMLATVAAGCTEHDGAQEGRSLEGQKITFAVSQVPTTSETRSVVSVADPLKLSGYTKELWLVPEVEPMVSNVTTRGVQLTSESILTDFGVSCFKTPSSMDDLDGRVPDYFYNLQAIRIGETTSYAVSQDYYWPSNDERLWFYAYYPYNGNNNVQAGDNLNVVLSSAAMPGPQTIDYTVAAAATDQVDLMTATTGKTDDFLTEDAPSVELQFEHQLTGIRFKVGDQFPTKGYIQSIQLKNVYTHGVYTIGGTWSHQSGDIGNFIVEYANDTKVTDTPGQMITDDNAVFLMIPATFTYEANTDEDDKAAIIVRFWDGDATQTVSASLEGTTWTAGQTVTYSLSSEKLTTLKIDHIDYATTPAGAPYTEWKNGDEVGLYVVANGKNGGTDLRYSNVKCTYVKPNEQTAGTWTISPAAAKDPLTNKDIQVTPIMYPGDNYYFYYPYHADGPNGTPSAGNESDASADKFWLSVTNAHTVLADQSTPANFKNSDLQIAKAVVPSDVNANDPTLDGSGLAASTIKATMARKVGLAVVALGTDQANKSVTFNNGIASTPTKDNVTAVAEFSGNIPKQNGSKYYFYTIAGEETSINSISTHKDSWEASLTYTLAAGASQEKTAHSDRRNWDYVNAVWKYSYESNNYYTLQLDSHGDYSYTFQVWGAQGGSIYNLKGGYGAYATGTAVLTSGETIYIMIGQRGECTEGATSYPNGGYGGANNTCYAGSGGGSTHIATTNALPKNMSNYSTTLLILAGGGGGATCHDPNGNGQDFGWNGEGGHAGGISGCTGTSAGGAYAAGTGGTQTSGGLGGWLVYDQPQRNGSFGEGSMDTGTANAGGGGGLYGGGGSWGAGGGGGSSYIGNSRLTDKHMAGYGCETSSATATRTISVSNVSSTATADYAKSGNGYARITLNRW